FAEDVEGVDGVAATVEDEVGGVEVDAEVRQVDVFHGAEEGGGGFLAGLEPEAEAEVVAVAGDLVQGVDDAGVVRVVHVFGDEAGVGGDGGDAEFGGEVGTFLQGGEAFGAPLSGDDADGGGAVHEVPLSGAGV